MCMEVKGKNRRESREGKGIGRGGRVRGRGGRGGKGGERRGREFRGKVLCRNRVKGKKEDVGVRMRVRK